MATLLFSCSSRRSPKKRAGKEELTESVSHVGPIAGLLEEVRKKWSDLKMKTHKYEISKKATGESLYSGLHIDFIFQLSFGKKS